MQDAAGVETVRVGRDAAHGMHADRPADHLVVAAAGPVRPRDVEHDLFLEGGVRQLGGDAADAVGGDTRLLLDLLRRILRGEKPLGQQLEYRHRLAAVGERERSRQRRLQRRGQGVNQLARGLVVRQRLAVGVARE